MNNKQKQRMAGLRAFEAISSPRLLGPGDRVALTVSEKGVPANQRGTIIRATKPNKGRFYNKGFYWVRFDMHPNPYTMHSALLRPLNALELMSEVK